MVREEIDGDTARGETVRAQDIRQQTADEPHLRAVRQVASLASPKKHRLRSFCTTTCEGVLSDAT